MAGTIELWREAEGRWRWAYREDELEILSNHPYATRGDAIDAASLAYPDATLVQPERAVAEPDPRRPSPVTLGLMILAVWRWYRRARAS